MSAPVCNGLKEISEKARNEFRAIFNAEPTICAYAPGRVNLIGEHTDYNDGFVMPMAIPLYTVILGARTKDSSSICDIYTSCIPPSHNRLQIDLNQEIKPVDDQERKWSNYVRGVMALFPCKFPGFYAYIASTVPLGGGLSSSASLEVAMLKFLQALSPENRYLSTKDQALVCQKAEHQFANVPCGIMDQYVVTHAQEGRALLIDCRDLTFEHLNFDDPHVSVLVTNSNVKHDLGTSEYSLRRSDCHKAVAILGKSSLRDVKLKELLENEKKLDSVTFRRAKHVVTEIERVEKAAEALRAKNYVQFGCLMNESHRSLRYDYEVSCAELDQLVDIAQKLKGVLGSRMTGGGFGGCTVTLVESEFVESLMESLKKGYTFGSPTFFVCRAVSGGGLLSFPA